MFGAGVNVAEILDRYVPIPAGAGDWASVVRDAEARPRRRRWPTAVAAIAAAVLAVGLAVLLAPSRHGGGSVIDRAKAAIGNGPVLHVVTREPIPRYVLLDLSTGARRPVYDELEEWSDPKLGTRWIDRADGHVVADSSWGVRDPDPTLQAFLTGYRNALASDDARVVGEGEIDGTPVYWLSIGSTATPEAAAQSRQVAVDRGTFAPVALRWVHGGVVGQIERVLEMNALPEGAGDFTSPAPPEDQPSRGDVIDSTDIAAGDAADVLKTTAFWAGPHAAGLPLSLVQRQSLKMVYDTVGKPPDLEAGLSLTYGSAVNGHPSADGTFVALKEASSPVFAYGWIPVEPALEPGILRLRSFAAAEGSTKGDFYRGELVRNGTYITLESFDEGALVAVAKALEPLG